MHIIKQRRKQLNDLTLAELSSRTGVPKQTLSDIESGLYLPSPEVARKIEQALQIQGLPDSSQILSEREIKSHYRARPFPVKPVDQRCWGVLEARLQVQLRKLKLQQNLIEWLKRVVPADSLAECLAHCSLLHAGAERVFVNPHRLGFRHRPILNSEGLALAEELLPAFRLKIKGKPCLLWPQVTLLTGVGQFRLDYLAFYRGQWFNVEIDGPGHNREDDEYRRGVLGLPEIRISHQTVMALHFPAALSRELEQRTHHVGLAA